MMWTLLIPLVFIFPGFPNGHYAPHITENPNHININGHDEQEDHLDSDDDDLNIILNDDVNQTFDMFLHERLIDQDVKWKLGLDSLDVQVNGEFQLLTLVTTKRYGKGLVIEGRLQNCERDEYIFHESLVHPALLAHNEPRTVFIMGGGSGSAAREVLKHKNIERVIICDIDQNVVELCREHMTANSGAFNDKRLQIVYNDAKDELEISEENFDVIIGDMFDPESYFSEHLYTKSFYEQVVKHKLKENGIFVTQAGPAGIFTHLAMFSPVYNTLKQVFKYVIAYKAQVPSFGDSIGWIMASDAPIILDAEELDNRIGERIRGELDYLDGPFIVASTVLNKTMKKSLMEEIRVLTEKTVRIIRRPGFPPPILIPS